MENKEQDQLDYELAKQKIKEQLRIDKSLLAKAVHLAVAERDAQFNFGLYSG